MSIWLKHPASTALGGDSMKENVTEQTEKKTEPKNPTIPGLLCVV